MEGMETMIGAAILAYGMLSSFVLSGAERNRRMQRPNPRMLQAVGYVLVGFSGAIAAGAPVAAWLGLLPH